MYDLDFSNLLYAGIVMGLLLALGLWGLYELATAFVDVSISFG